MAGKTEIAPLTDAALAEHASSRTVANFLFWKFIHNAIVHPLMAWPWDEPAWLNAVHDWTAERCKGRG